MRAIVGSILAVMVTAGAVGLAWQHRESTRLRDQLLERRAANAAARRLAEEHRQLEAVQVSPTELAARRDERSAMTALLLEIEAIRRRTTGSDPASAGGTPAQPEAASSQSMRNEEVAVAAWTNRGAGAPDDAFETLLWAAAGGDLETMTGLLALDDAARVRADGMFARLPAALRQDLGTADKLVALLTAKAIPLGSARILTQADEPGRSRLSAQLRDASGQAREIQITLRGEAGRWRLVVPVEAMDRLADQLRPASVALRPVTVPPGS